MKPPTSPQLARPARWIATGALLFALGCQQGTTRMPMTAHHAPSYQQEVLRAEHWRAMATDLAGEISDRLGVSALAVQHPDDTGNRFQVIYPQLLESALSTQGIPLARQAPVALEIETYYLTYAESVSTRQRVSESSHQATMGAMAGAVLGYVIGRYQDARPEGALIGATAGSLLGGLAYDTNHTTFWSRFGHTVRHTFTGDDSAGRSCELVVSTTLRAQNGDILGKFAQIVYVNGHDLHLYARPAHRSISLVDEI